MALRRRNDEDQLVPHGRGINMADIEYIRNMAGHVRDYLMGEGDFNTGNKKFKSDDTNMEVGNGDAPQVRASMGNSSNGGVYRGALVGNTQMNREREEHYLETLKCYSKKIRCYTYFWALSRWYNSGDDLPLHPLGTTGATGKVMPGAVYLRTTDIWNEALSYFNPNSLNNRFNLNDKIYTNCINFTLDDFVDNKLLNDKQTSKGIFNNYSMFRLKNFTIKLVFKTQIGGLHHEAPWIMNKFYNDNGFTTNDKRFESSYNPPHTTHDRQRYYVYRDEQNDYLSPLALKITNVPDDATKNSTEKSKVSREMGTVKNLDKNLTIIEDGEEFSFTRNINAVGNYYITKDAITSNLDMNINNIVALLEGQTQSNFAKPMVEGFGILFGPENPVIDWHGEFKLQNAPEIKGYIPIVNSHTKVYVKTLATWEAFNFDHTSNPVTFRMGNIRDPLEDAINNYKLSSIIQETQLTKGI